MTFVVNGQTMRICKNSLCFRKIYAVLFEICCGLDLIPLKP